jgi:hypothetical protein
MISLKGKIVMKKFLASLFIGAFLFPPLLFAQPSKYLKLGANYSSFRTEKSESGLTFGFGKDFYPSRSFNGFFGFDLSYVTKNLKLENKIWPPGFDLKDSNVSVGDIPLDRSYRNIIFRGAGPDNLIIHESSSRHNLLSSIRLNKSLSNRKKGNHALWFQGGFGAASTDIYDQNQPSELFLHGEFSVHFRRYHNIMAIGVDSESVEAWGIKTLWGTYGYSYSRSWLEASLNAGIGYSQWYHHTESDRGTIHSPHVPSLIIRAQTILHLRQLFGFGLVLTGNVNKESYYVAGGFVFALGLWNW